MKKKLLNRMLALAFGVAFVAPSVTSMTVQMVNAESRNYIIRDYSQYAESANFMVGGFYAPDLTNESEVALMQASGLDFITLNGNNYTSNVANLGTIFENFDQNGFKILLNAFQCSNLSAMGYKVDANGQDVGIDEEGTYVTHTGWNRDCVIGTDMWDEPGTTADLDTIAKYKDAFETAFPGKTFFVNFASHDIYGTGTFDQRYIDLMEYYAENVLEDVQGERVISNDPYPFCKPYNSNDYYIRQNYLADLATAAIFAKNYDASLSYYVQTMDCGQENQPYHSSRNVAGQADIDMEYSIAMAFGAKQIINFCYETPVMPEGEAFLSEAMVTADGTPTDTYYWVQNRIAKVDSMDEAYMNFDWNGVIISKGTTYDRFSTANNKYNKTAVDCYGQITNSFFSNEIAYASSYNTSSVTKNSLTKGNLSSVTSTETTLVGCFEDDMGYNGYMLANANDTTRGAVSTVTMTFDGNTDKVRIYRGTSYSDETLNGNTLTLSMNSGEGVFVVPYKTENGYSITLNVNGATESTFVLENSSFTLPERTVDGEMFIGWEYNGKAYPVGYTIDNITSDIALTAITLDMDMRVGASVRIASDYENSIRWIADVNKNSLTAFENAVGTNNVSYGVTVKSSLITGSLTINIPKENFGNSGNAWTLAGVMTKVPDEQLNTLFEGRAFVKVTFADGTQKKIFASGNDNVRSIAQVAYMAYNDKDYGYTEAQLERLLVLSLPYTESSDNNGSLNDWIAGMDKDNLGSLEDWLLNAGK